MTGHKNGKIAKILRQAEAAGLTYGQFVAKEYHGRTKRRPIPKNCISINDRKKHKINAPLYLRNRTLSEALWLDCPKLAAKEAAKARRRIK
ncbi:MAG: hypothetical protein NC299_11770 [Lachnospiraceae bacterium]|nr:hypothetical protein [Lachnospiraceae bacterium]